MMSYDDWQCGEINVSGSYSHSTLKLNGDPISGNNKGYDNAR